MSPSCHQLINPIFTEQQQHNLTSILRLLAKVAKVKRWSDILDDHKKRQMTNKQTNRQTESAPLLFFPLTGNRHCHEDHTLPRSRVRVENGYSERERGGKLSLTRALSLPSVAQPTALPPQQSHGNYRPLKNSTKRSRTKRKRDTTNRALKIAKTHNQSLKKMAAGKG